MATRMQQRKGTAAQWISTNSGNGPVLNAGEIGYETDTNKFKIGDGTNHWVDLNYFADEVALGGSIDDYIPLTDKGAINGVAALNADKNVIVPGASIIVEGATDNGFETTITVADPTADRTITFPDANGTVLLADGSGNITISGDLTVSGTTTTINSTTINATTGIVFEGPSLNAFETTVSVADPTADRTITFPDASGTVALTTDVTDHSSLTTNVHGITDAAELATKSFAAELLTNATKTNITITGNKDGLTITAENGVADSTTDNLTEGSTNKYFTDERAQDATAAALAAGTHTNITVTYDDNGNSISLAAAPGYVDEQAVDAVAAALAAGTHTNITVSYNDNGNAISLTGANTYSDENAQDAVGNAVGAGLSYNDSTGAISVDTSTIQARVANVSDTEIGYLDGVTSAIQTQLGARLPLSGGTMTGAITLSGAPTSDLHAATKLYVDNVTAGINFHEAVHATTTVNLAANYSNGTSGVGATLTADTNRAFTTIDGESVTLGQRVLIKNQTDAKQNGIYTLTTVGSVSVPWVLTRATDADNSPVGEMKTGDFTFVQNGTTFGGIGFINNSATNPIVIGTDNISYTEFNAAKTVVAGNGLSEAIPGTLSINTAITADLSTAQTLTNKTINGSNNTISNIAISTAVSGLGTGVATFLGTPSSANLISAITDETGTGALVFGTSPTIATPTLTLSSTTSTTSGRIAFDATNDKIIVGDGTSAIEFAPSTTLINAQTASYTLVAADKDKMVEMGVGSANTLTVPLNSSIAYPIGTKITVVQTGTGQTTITPTSGVTINGTPGLKLRAQWSAVTLVKRGTDTWVAFGDLTA